MERQVDSRIFQIKNLILAMGGFVEKALDEAIQALIQRKMDAFKAVHEIEEKINSEHIRVDSACMSFLAMQGPVARDLRLIVSIIKINTDLERMGDQCVNIAHTGKDYLMRAPVSQNFSDLEHMSLLVRKMVKESLDCFVREDEKKAQEILLMDDEVDRYKSKIFAELAQYIQTHPDQVLAALDIILIARNLERLGDHATNIAEDVIYVSTGKDVRHGGRYS
jgi:phosphate transport system protein